MTTNATILNHIGNTPLLKLNHVTKGLGVDIYVKCEFTKSRRQYQGSHGSVHD